MAQKISSFENVTINLEHDIDEQYQYQPGEIIRGKIGNSTGYLNYSHLLDVIIFIDFTWHNEKFTELPPFVS